MGIKSLFTNTRLKQGSQISSTFDPPISLNQVSRFYSPGMGMSLQLSWAFDISTVFSILFLADVSIYKYILLNVLCYIESRHIYKINIIIFPRNYKYKKAFSAITQRRCNEISSRYFTSLLTH